MGKQITLSSDWNVVWKGRDTVLNDFTKVPIKLVVYYDSLVCNTCYVGKMNEWEDKVAYADSLAQWFSIIYLFSPKKVDLARVNMALRSHKFDYPVFIDQRASFAKQNPELSKKRLFHSFLLDKDNRVVLVGNPLHNPPLWELYKRTIQKMIDNDGVFPEQSGT